jgi:hypothetical protein
MFKDRSAIATAARTGLTRVAMERVAEYMRRRTWVPRLLRRMTMPKAA